MPTPLSVSCLSKSSLSLSSEYLQKNSKIYLIFANHKGVSFPRGNHWNDWLNIWLNTAEACPYQFIFSSSSWFYSPSTFMWLSVGFDTKSSCVSRTGLEPMAMFLAELSKGLESRHASLHQTITVFGVSLLYVGLCPHFSYLLYFLCLLI